MSPRRHEGEMAVEAMRIAATGVDQGLQRDQTAAIREQTEAGTQQSAETAQALLTAAGLERKREDIQVTGAIAHALLDVAAAIREHTAMLERQAVAPRAFGPR